MKRAKTIAARVRGAVKRKAAAMRSKPTVHPLQERDEVRELLRYLLAIATKGAGLPDYAPIVPGPELRKLVPDAAVPSGDAEAAVETIMGAASHAIRQLERGKSVRATVSNPCACRKNGRPSPAALARARAEYMKTHWGERGGFAAKQLRAADPRLVSVCLGELVTVVYRTKKGGWNGDGGAETDYVHDFVSPLPFLAFNAQGLLILGGGYTVTERGIVR